MGARIVSQKLGEALGQPRVIESRPGASGTLGVDAVTKAAPSRLDSEMLRILQDETLRKRFNELGMEASPVSQDSSNGGLP